MSSYPPPLPSESDSPFASLIARLNQPGRPFTHQHAHAVIDDFSSIFHSLPDNGILPDVAFEAVFRALLQAVAQNTITVDLVRYFVREYSIGSRTRLAAILAAEVRENAMRVAGAEERFTSLNEHAPPKSSPRPSQNEYIANLAQAADVLELAKQNHNASKLKLRRAEEQRTLSIAKGAFDKKFKV